MNKHPSVSKALIVFASTLALGAISGCTKKEEAPATPPPAQAPVAAAAGSNTAVDPNKKPDAELTLGSDGDNMAFNKTELTAKAGSWVRVTMVNNAKGTAGMQHNWVLVRPGTETEVANAGIQAGEASDWVPASPNVVAHTHLLKKGDGEKDSITFIAPPAGDYPYVCTFPGHAVVMKGVFKSTL